MYTPSQTQQLHELSQRFLDGRSEITAEKIEELRKMIRFHEHRYYVMDEPLLSDEEYDQLYKMLENLEQAYPDLVTPQSPTQRVGSSLNQSFVTVPHIVPMLSLANSYNQQDLVDWDRKAREVTGLTEVEYCIEPKFDGASISLLYEADILTRAATRGNGVEGEDITTNIKQVRSIPLAAAFSHYGVQQAEIRGEVMMNKKAFKKYNDMLAGLNLAPLANARNAASGSLRMKDPKEVGKRGLEAFLYNVSYFIPTANDTDVARGGQLLNTHAGSLEMLGQLGFKSPDKEKRVVKGIQAVIDHVGDFEALRDDLPYEVDGMVIKVNSLELQEKLGMTTHHPRWAMAFKFKARQATSKLRTIEYQVGRTGSVTPVAKIEPVQLAGVTVGSISLFNEDIIKEKDLMIGDMVLVERAGDVIPYIVKSLAELRTGNEKPVIFPTTCPVCAGKLFKEEGEAVWRCINIECPAQVVEKMIHFVSKNAMDIKSFGEANIRKFYELGILKDIPGIYKLDFDAVSMLEGFGKKSIINLQEAIEASKTQPLNRLIFGLGIRFVGETTAKVLSNTVHHLLDLQSYTSEQMQQLEDVGVKVAGSIAHFFQNNQNLLMLQELQHLGVKMTNEKKVAVAEGALSGKTFLFTGTLTKLKRTEAEELVEHKGGKLLGSVSSKLNYLVVGDDAGSKFEKAKKINSIRIISEDEFLHLVK